MRTLILSTVLILAAAKRPRVMRPLSEVFAPGAPTLPERLRTLVVSPERELEPGITVQATFTFRNHGGAPATGVRLRFNVPEGLVYLVGSGRLDGEQLDDELGNSPLLARTGADAGDVAPGQERRAEIAYSVAGAIENGTTIELQAAVASFEVAPVGSNVVRLVARSRPQLHNALTGIAIEPARDPVPGAQAQITLRIHNAGESTAHDVAAVAPIPEHTTYLAGSARVNGREIESQWGAPLDRLSAPVVVRALPARATATLTYRVVIDSPLAGGTPIVARADIASQEMPAFALEPSALTIVSAPDFGDQRTTFITEDAADVHPGKRVRLELTAFNAGTAAATRVSAQLELPEQLLFVRGSATLDGHALPQKRKEPLHFELGPVDAGESLTLYVDAIVASPLPDATTLTAAATLEYEPAGRDPSRRLECTIAVRSEPAFSPRRNGLTRAGAERIAAGSAIETVAVLQNDGSAQAHDAVLHLRMDPPLLDVAVTEGSTRLTLEAGTDAAKGDVVDLGTIEPLAARRVTIRARVPVPCANATEIRLAASLHTRELGETRLPAAHWRVDSQPAFDAATSRFEIGDASVLRPNQLAEVDVTVANAGTDAAQNVTLRCYVSPEARLESVEGATRERSLLLFGELAPGSRARARLSLRLLRGLAKDWPVTVEGVLSADGMLPVQLERLVIATTAEPNFSAGSFHSEPSDLVDLGETIEWTLHVRNGGDGVARVVHVEIAPPDSLVYVPNSTTVNDVPVRDGGALPPFAVPRGITLADVDPGVEATIRWHSVVHNALPAGTTILHVAHVRYDGERDDEIVSNELRVRATPVFATAIAGLPFGLDGMLGPALGGTRALTEERFVQLPPATPVSGGEGNGSVPLVQLAAAPDEPAESDFYETPSGGETVGTIAAFDAVRLGRTIRFLREARFGGLVTHLFALRAFLPEAIGDGRVPALGPTRDLLREELDRLFIKLRLPHYAIAQRDVETPSLRSTFEHLLREVSGAHGTPPQPPAAPIALRGSFDPTESREYAERLNSAPLASALPWSALARLLPDETAQSAGYRSELVATLDRFDDSEADEFLDALAHAAVPSLDAALDATIASLHAMA